MYWATFHSYACRRSQNKRKGRSPERLPRLAASVHGSIYKVTEFPGMKYEKLFHLPKGTLNVEMREHSVMVTCSEHYQVECFDDHSWHLMVDMGDGTYKADLYHKPEGFPLWYGREKPSLLTQHSVTYGYNWAGRVNGTIWLDGRQVKVDGFGIRERYVAVDSSAAELGGWEDWGFFAFNEIHSSMYDMRLGVHAQPRRIHPFQVRNPYRSGGRSLPHPRRSQQRHHMGSDVQGAGQSGGHPHIRESRRYLHRQGRDRTPSDRRTRSIVHPPVARLPQHSSARTLFRRTAHRREIRHTLRSGEHINLSYSRHTQYDKFACITAFYTVAVLCDKIAYNTVVSGTA